MGGTFSLGYDLSSMIRMSNEMDASIDTDERDFKKMDTVIVFNELFEEYKDSIASLPKEEQLELEKLRGLTMTIHEDDEKEEFSMTIGKDFETVSELLTINEQVEQAFKSTMGKDKDKQKAMGGDMGNMNTELEQAIYTFKGNTFTRHQPKKVQEDTTEPTDEEAFQEPMDSELDQLTEESFYIITYSFPKKIKSVSHKDAQISKDGKSFTLSLPWDAVDKDNALLNLTIALEK